MHQVCLSVQAIVHVLVLSLIPLPFHPPLPPHLAAWCPWCSSSPCTAAVQAVHTRPAAAVQQAARPGLGQRAGSLSPQASTASCSRGRLMTNPTRRTRPQAHPQACYLPTSPSCKRGAATRHQLPQAVQGAHGCPWTIIITHHTWRQGQRTTPGLAAQQHTPMTSTRAHAGSLWSRQGQLRGATPAVRPRRRVWLRCMGSPHLWRAAEAGALQGAARL